MQKKTQDTTTYEGRSLYVFGLVIHTKIYSTVKL